MAIQTQVHPSLLRSRVTRLNSLLITVILVVTPVKVRIWARAIHGAQLGRQTIENSPLQGLDGALAMAELIPDGNQVRAEANRSRNAEDMIVV
jgi:hypothetical protein